MFVYIYIYIYILVYKYSCMYIRIKICIYMYPFILPSRRAPKCLRRVSQTLPTNSRRHPFSSCGHWKKKGGGNLIQIVIIFLD